MARKKRNRVKYFLVAVVLFAVMFAGAFLGIQFVTKTGIFRIPGVVYYDESLNDSGVRLRWPYTASYSFIELCKPLCHNKAVICEGGNKFGGE